MNRICPVCKKDYEDGGHAWKKKCFECWKNYRSSERIKKLRWKENVYVTHPSVTAEELNQWIKDNGEERGWGAQEINVENYGKRFRVFSTAPISIKALKGASNGSRRTEEKVSEFRKILALPRPSQ